MLSASDKGCLAAPQRGTDGGKELVGPKGLLQLGLEAVVNCQPEIRDTFQRGHGNNRDFTVLFWAKGTDVLKQLEAVPVR